MRLNKKAQVDVDSLLSYIVYLFFIFFTINYILELTNPFRDIIDNQIQEKRSIILYKRFQKAELPYIYFQNLCNESVPPFYNFYAEYTIKSFLFSGNDKYNLLPNETEGAIHFSRSEKELNIIAGSISEVYNTTLILEFPGWLSISVETDIDSNDYVNYTINRQGNHIYNMSLNFGGEDIDRVIFKTQKDEDSIVTIQEITGIPLENVYLGYDFKFMSSCGEEIPSTKKATVQYISAIQKNQTSAAAVIKINGWWYY
ncbi:MAG: hypothetical protein PHW96_03585 [Candidatus Nanoarchaeia archaeon]|nr:hypothetical protein [Candidatus Nanoarchaeia archaeon]